VKISVNHSARTTEIIGKNWLCAQVLQAGLNISEPLIDDGIDLVVFAVNQSPKQSLIAKPIQLKTSKHETWGSDKKLGKVPNLIIVHVWNVYDLSKTEAYAFTYKEAIHILRKVNRGNFFKKHGKIRFAKITKSLQKQLDKFRMTPEKWKAHMLVGINSGK